MALENIINHKLPALAIFGAASTFYPMAHLIEKTIRIIPTQFNTTGAKPQRNESSTLVPFQHTTRIAQLASIAFSALTLGLGTLVYAKRDYLFHFTKLETGLLISLGMLIASRLDITINPPLRQHYKFPKDILK